MFVSSAFLGSGLVEPKADEGSEGNIRNSMSKDDPSRLHSALLIILQELETFTDFHPSVLCMTSTAAVLTVILKPQAKDNRFSISSCKQVEDIQETSYLPEEYFAIIPIISQHGSSPSPLIITS